MDLKMKSTIIIATALFFLCIANSVTANDDLEFRTVWPEAVTFSKFQMTRLDQVDPSYENRLKNIRSTNSSQLFGKWKSLIDAAL